MAKIQSNCKNADVEGFFECDNCGWTGLEYKTVNREDVCPSCGSSNLTASYREKLEVICSHCEDYPCTCGKGEQYQVFNQMLNDYQSFADLGEEWSWEDLIKCWQSKYLVTKNKNQALDTAFTKRPHREICGLCHRESAVSFHVPNEIWEVAVHPGHINDIHCLGCFIARADAQLLPWDKHITFFPCSLRTQLENFPLDNLKKL